MQVFRGNTADAEVILEKTEQNPTLCLRAPDSQKVFVEDLQRPDPDVVVIFHYKEVVEEEENEA